MLFSIGFNPKYSNAVVRLAGEKKGDIMVWGFKYRTGSHFKVQPCVLVIRSVFCAQSTTWLCSLSVLCIVILECDGTQLIYRCLEKQNEPLNWFLVLSLGSTHIKKSECQRENQGPVPLHSPGHWVVSSKPEMLGFVKAAAKPLGIVKVHPRFSDLSEDLN